MLVILLLLLKRATWNTPYHHHKKKDHFDFGAIALWIRITLSCVQHGKVSHQKSHPDMMFRMALNALIR
tara:strand:+ start:127 stop:333 length:207 start_codon:yes stop_codon:yes gene_type:complete